MRQIPSIRYKKDAKKLATILKKAHADVTRELLDHLETGSIDSFVEQEASLNRQIKLILDKADEAILPEVERMINDSHVKGQAQAILSLGDAKTLHEATQGVSFSLLSNNTVNRLIEDTFEDVLAITSRTDRRTKKIIRETSGEILRMNAIKQIGYDTSRQQIMEKLLKQGFSKTVKNDFKGVTDSIGRKWKLDSYVNMLTHTKMSQAYSEGIRSESMERGTDLAVISSHGAEDDCSKYEGMVISMTGATEGYLTYDELRESNEIFHPNCEHTITPLRDIELLPKSLQDTHYRQMEKL